MFIHYQTLLFSLANPLYIANFSGQIIKKCLIGTYYVKYRQNYSIKISLTVCIYNISLVCLISFSGLEMFVKALPHCLHLHGLSPKCSLVNIVTNALPVLMFTIKYNIFFTYDFTLILEMFVIALPHCLHIHGLFIVCSIVNSYECLACTYIY